jgi:hypothetical protein
MTSSFPRESLIAANNEFFGFKIFSGLFGLAPKYIIGIACLYSRKPELALQFHEAVLETPLGGLTKSRTSGTLLGRLGIWSPRKHSCWLGRNRSMKAGCQT